MNNINLKGTSSHFSKNSEDFKNVLKAIFVVLLIAISFFISNLNVLPLNDSHNPQSPYTLPIFASALVLLTLLINICTVTGKKNSAFTSRLYFTFFVIFLCIALVNFLYLPPWVQTNDSLISSYIFDEKSASIFNHIMAFIPSAIFLYLYLPKPVNDNLSTLFHSYSFREAVIFTILKLIFSIAAVIGITVFLSGFALNIGITAIISGFISIALYSYHKANNNFMTRFLLIVFLFIFILFTCSFLVMHVLPTQVTGAIISSPYELKSGLSSTV